ncbi:MAG: 6,7-dimethyl-8-ribityllumazine synthase [Candidatus Omnitrophota bacterium]|nr:6,7-dimethyl-8-ribityllumazine synthase [Candidatus Omnitrophota bacterium]
MAKTIEGKLITAGKKFAIVASRFNNFITRRLLEGAEDTLLRHGAKETDITMVWVPGSFEIGLAVLKLAKSKKYDAVISLGAIIRGETPHFDYIASQASKGAAQIMLTTGVPVAFGIVTADSLEQAIQRAGAKEGNKGSQAALSAIEMSNLLEKI